MHFLSGDAVAELLSAENLIAFLTLAALEIVLGIDNIVMIAVLTAKLDPKHQSRARRVGLLLAMGMRIALLLAIGWVMGLTEPLFAVFGHDFAGKDLIQLTGGLFLLGKATYEIHHKMEPGAADAPGGKPVYAGFGAVIAQIVAMDIVFSLDSVITAVGMAKEVIVMIAAVVVSVAVMMAFADPISSFVERHPTVKMLALSFLVLIGALLVAEGMGRHVEKGYIYFAMGFSLTVEMLNLRAKAARERAAAA